MKTTKGISEYGKAQIDCDRYKGTGKVNDMEAMKRARDSRCYEDGNKLGFEMGWEAACKWMEVSDD